MDVLGKSLEKQMIPSFSQSSLGNKVGSGLYTLSVEREKGEKFVRVVKE
ncbi:MAG: hypothetical protein K2Q22_03810 [Cytophagales bacterium]|nr:hypothetical protein [Cytophagales bacterium]